MLLLLFIIFISIYTIIYLKICSRVYNFVATLWLKYIVHELLLLLILLLLVVVVDNSSSSGGYSNILLNFIHKPHDGWSQGKFHQLHPRKFWEDNF